MPLRINSDVYLLRCITLVMACLTVIPAFSTSFLVKPIVRQIFRAGCGWNAGSLGLLEFVGRDFRRVISTPFANVYHNVISNELPESKDR